MAVEPHVHLIEASQHSLFESRNIVSDVENLPMNPIEPNRQRLVQRCETGQNVFVFHHSMRRHRRYPKAAKLCPVRCVTVGWRTCRDEFTLGAP